VSVDCLFCRIGRGELAADVIARGETWMAFRDIRPQAPVHALVIPFEHIQSIAALDERDRGIVADLMLAARDVARLEGVEETGFRVVTNVGERAGQSVFHLHLHVLGGRPMEWPPG